MLPLRVFVLVGMLSGATAGWILATVETAWSAQSAGQYLHGFGQWIFYWLHLSTSYLLAGSTVGILVFLLGHLLAQSPVAKLAADLREEKKPGFPSGLLAGVLPSFALCATVGYQSALQSLVHRKHAGLVLIVSSVLGVLAVIASVALANLLARVWRAVRAFPTPIARAGSVSFALLNLGSLAVVVAQLRTASSFVPVLVVFFAAALVVFGPRLLHGSTQLRSRSGTAAKLLLSAFGALPLALAIGYLLAARVEPSQRVLQIATGLAMAALGYCLAFVALMTLLARIRPLDRWVATLTRAALLLLAMLVVAALLLWLLFAATLAQIPLRPWLAMLGFLVLFVPVSSFWMNRYAHLPSWMRTPLHFILLPGVSLALVVVSGSGSAVRKAAVLHSGLGGPLISGYQFLGDWDRDGYSRWLGGGDCNDANPDIHPGASDIPFDGIDNNCLRGDVGAGAKNDTHFVSLPPTLPPQMNVIFLTIDTLRADHLGAYGYSRDTSPNLDRLAREGTLFQNAWAHAPSTRYSIPAMLTGRYPLQVKYLNIPGQWPGLHLDNRTIAEIMQGSGRSTGAILNYWYFDKIRNMDQGFAYYDNQNARLHKSISGAGPAKTSGSSSAQQTDKAIEFVDKNSEQPFFLWVHYYDPHFDYETHEGITHFGEGKIDAYDHEVAFTDREIGRLLSHLRDKGLDKNTAIVVTGDHGEGFGEHGIDLHGYHLYAAQTKVPLLMFVPGLAPSVVTMPVGHVDILPTLANLVGAPSTPAMQGRSLLGVLTKEQDPASDRVVFQQLSYENNNEYRGAVSQKCHVLYNVSPHLSWESYRIDKDPMETRDLSDLDTECQDTRAALESWYEVSEIPEGAMEALMSEAPDIASSLQLDFGGKIVLHELQLPERVKRGTSFPITLLWESTTKGPADHRIFAHFESANGGRFTGDHEPVRPFSWWRPGDFVRYEHTIAIPHHIRPGKYTLWFGVYKGKDRLTPAGEFEIVDGRAHLGEIEVLP